MRRLRPAVAETAYSGGLLAAAGIAVALLVEPTPRTGHLIGALILFALFTPVLVLPVTRRLRAEAPGAEGEPVGPPIFLVVVQLPFVAAGALVVVASDLELSLYGAFVACLGLSQLVLAARLRRIERERGVRVLLRPVYRLTGEHGLGRGWFDAANFVAAPTSKP
jgi:hypothetical protein